MASKRWTPAKLEEVRQQALVMNMNELAAYFNCGYSTIYLLCKNHGIKALSEKPRWSREVKSFILDNNHMSCRELAQATGMNQDSIRHLLRDVYGPRWRLLMKDNLSKEK